MPLYSPHFLTLLIFVFLLPTGKAQVFDDFSDGNLSENPRWLGDTTHFIINTDGRLQLKAPGAGESLLYTPVQLPDSAYWEAWFRMDFAPSAANNLRIYLLLDHPEPDSANGYFLEVGENGNQDALNLYRLEEGEALLVGRGPDGSLAGDPVLLRIRVERTPPRNWRILAAPDGDRQFSPVFSLAEPPIRFSQSYFGLACKYTASRTDRFLLDDLSASPWFRDTQPPGLLAVKALSDTSLQMHFDEPVLFRDSLLHLIDLSGPTHHITQMHRASASRWDVTTEPAFQPLNQYRIELQELTDTSGNTRTQVADTFRYERFPEVQAYQVLINEIMADPSPTIGLPESEYIELWNRSQTPVQAGRLEIGLNGTFLPLPESVIPPGGFLVLVGATSTGREYGTFAVPFPGLPRLPNSGGEIILRDSSGTVVHAVAYQSEWHPNSSEREGGWSLERLPGASPCREAGNWTSSADFSGGSPGRVNPVYEKAPGDPGTWEAWPEDPDHIRLFGDRALSRSDQETGSWGLETANGIRSVHLLAPFFRELSLQPELPLQPGNRYQIRPPDTIRDCENQAFTPPGAIPIALPDSCSKKDLIINEILFDPEEGGVEFIELFNRSEKVIDLTELLIGRITPSETSLHPVNVRQLLFPGEFAALTQDPAQLRRQYPECAGRRLVQQELPSLPKEEGQVSLLYSRSGTTVVIDSLTYLSDWHHPLLTTGKGVSLERIDPDGPSNKGSNWHSAAQTAGFATPAAQNSQYLALDSAATDLVSLPRTTFSPNGDGLEDYLPIRIRTGKPGYLLNAEVYDLSGSPIAVLATSKSLGTEDQLHWTGQAGDGGMALPGIYILRLVLFHPDGDRRVVKYCCRMLANP